MCVICMYVLVCVCVRLSMCMCVMCMYVLVCVCVHLSMCMCVMCMYVLVCVGAYMCECLWHVCHSYSRTARGKFWRGKILLNLTNSTQFANV